MDIILPFVLAGVLGGWIYRSITGQGYNFYAGFLKEYGVSTGILTVVALMIVSSVISMSIRQIRHLSEKPTDFFRLPIFIIVSTFFLMPIRLLGFFRMAHASGWGTRAGAYAGGPAEMTSVDDLLLAEASKGAESAPATNALPDAVGGVTTATALATRAELRTKTATAEKPKRAERRRLNPYAAIPYLIGFTILTLEALFLV
jgi:hyaluronan synthase